MSTTPASLSALTTTDDDEPTIVETLEEAAFILEENPKAAVLIQPNGFPKRA